jgi:Immunity protein 35
MVLQDAFTRAQAFLDEWVRPSHQVELVISAVVDVRTAWVFSYNSRRYLENREVSTSLVGNGPVIVPKSGSLPFLSALFGLSYDEQVELAELKSANQG